MTVNQIINIKAKNKDCLPKIVLFFPINLEIVNKIHSE